MGYGELFAELRAPAPDREGFRRRMYARDGFNESQIEAILAPLDQSTQVQAGAGTGKTKVFVSRVEHLLSKGVSPDDMLICTFTRNAAEEIRHRLPQVRDQLRNLGTIHSLALRAQPRMVQKAAPILTDEQVLGLLEQLLPQFPSGVQDAKDALLALSRMRENRAVRPEYIPLLNRLRQAMAEAGGQDFLSMLEAGLATTGNRRFRHILVDEVQDVTRLQAEWLRYVSTPETRFFCVGDENQAIYGFRGVSAMVAGESRLLCLDTNYRCSPEILQYSEGFLPAAPGLKAALPHGNPVQVVDFPTDEDELDAVACAYLAAADKDQFRVLTRSNALARPFLQRGIPAMTVHAAKGREWAAVWLAGMEDGNFPDARGDLDEERRLAYVAGTRARASLTVSWAAERSIGAKRRKHHPSPLLSRD